MARAKAAASATLIRAQAQAESIKIIADAESVYISKLKDASNAEIAGQIILSQKYIDGMNTISSNPSDKVFLPNSFQGMFEISTNKK